MKNDWNLATLVAFNTGITSCKGTNHHWHRAEEFTMVDTSMVSLDYMPVADLGALFSGAV